MARFGSGATSDREISAIRASQRARKAEARGDHGVALGLHEQAAMTNRRAGRIAEAEQHERAAQSLRQTIAQGGARAVRERAMGTARTTPTDVLNESLSASDEANAASARVNADPGNAELHRQAHIAHTRAAQIARAGGHPTLEQTHQMQADRHGRMVQVAEAVQGQRAEQDAPRIGHRSEDQRAHDASMQSALARVKAAERSQTARAASASSTSPGADHTNRYNEAVRQAMALSSATPHGRGARKGETTHKSAATAHLRAAAAAEAAGMHDVASRHREVAREHAERKQHHPHLKVLTPVAAAAREQSHPTPRPPVPGPQAVVSGGGTGKRGGQFIIVNGKKLYGKQREAFLSRKR